MRLEEIKAWANQKIATGAEPPWAWYQYMKLIETVEAILAGMAATTTVGSPQSESLAGRHLQLVGADDQPDSAPLHHVGLPVQLPM